jgi:hypothetical protein
VIYKLAGGHDVSELTVSVDGSMVTAALVSECDIDVAPLQGVLSAGQRSYAVTSVTKTSATVTSGLASCLVRPGVIFLPPIASHTQSCSHSSCCFHLSNPCVAFFGQAFYSAPLPRNTLAWLGAAMFAALEVLGPRSLSRADFAASRSVPDWDSILLCASIPASADAAIAAAAAAAAQQPLVPPGKQSVNHQRPREWGGGATSGPPAISLVPM